MRLLCRNPSSKIDTANPARHHYIAQDDVDPLSLLKNFYGLRTTLSFDDHIAQGAQEHVRRLSNRLIVIDKEKDLASPRWCIR